jgi:large subunit ribosomal protein L4
VPSTRTALAAIKAATESSKVLVVLHRDEDLAWVSLRNVATVHALAVDQLNAYDVLVNDEIVFTSAALDAFVAGPVGGKSAKAVATESEAVAASPVVVEESEAAAEDTSEPTNEKLKVNASAAEVLGVDDEALRQAQGTADDEEEEK